MNLKDELELKTPLLESSCNLTSEQRNSLTGKVILLNYKIFWFYNYFFLTYLVHCWKVNDKSFFPGCYSSYPFTAQSPYFNSYPSNQTTGFAFPGAPTSAYYPYQPEFYNPYAAQNAYQYPTTDQNDR